MSMYLCRTVLLVFLCSSLRVSAGAVAGSVLIRTRLVNVTYVTQVKLIHYRKVPTLHQVHVYQKVRCKSCNDSPPLLHHAHKLQSSMRHTCLIKRRHVHAHAFIEIQDMQQGRWASSSGTPWVFQLWQARDWTLCICMKIYPGVRLEGMVVAGGAGCSCAPPWEVLES